MTVPRLFEPLALREVRTRNRIVVSPMCQYSAAGGMVNDWHLVHLGKFAQGGAGIVFVEATAVEARGRITHGDVGLILTPRQAEEALFNPNWPLHAALELGADPDFAHWPRQYGWWLTRREASLAREGIARRAIDYRVTSA